MNMSKYKFFYSNSMEVIAVSSFYGKTVRGKAKCSPEDKFNLEKGKVLAAARCDLKIAKLRNKFLEKKVKEAIEAEEQAHNKTKKAIEQHCQAYVEMLDACTELMAIEKELQ